MLKILVAEKRGIDAVAAAEFVSLWRQVTGEKIPVTVRDDRQSDLVVLGSDARNSFTHKMIVNKAIPPFRLVAGSDGYALRSAEDATGRKLLFIAGGRPRALLYGVYRFFELRAKCRYFWDGDLVPKAEKIDLTGLDIAESPRFYYRGLRYFAHRSLTRFQAEHWDFDDWKREIDWILKKRLNLFMLRIGIDDLFQKAFPEIVPCPKGYEVSGSKPRSYDDRTLFWSLKYRAELRKKVLAYARERDLWHPEDVGTMTHWYSRTPDEYLDKVKPALLPQATKIYGEKNGLVWDIRRERELDAYWKLTEAHIREYGSPEIFHTIGLAERRCCADRNANHRLKLYTYRRIQKKLREHYPNAPLLIASWDFSMYWHPEEVRELVKELDPERTLILDYTSDTDDEQRNFLNWGLCGKFPWIFGIFHAYEPSSEPRGNYAAIARRLPVAAADPMCKGFVFWPENSHTDTLMLEFFAANAWDPAPSNVKIADFLEKFCAARYDAPTAKKMLPLWRAALPFIEARHWNGPCAREERNFAWLFSEFFFAPASRLQNDLSEPRRAPYFCREMAVAAAAPKLLRRFAALKPESASAFVRRDALDLVRTIASRALCRAFAELSVAVQKWRDGANNADGVDEMFAQLLEQERVFTDVLASDREYSLYASLLELRAKHRTNPGFEYTLKGNAENHYCRSFITELFAGVCMPELAVCRAVFREAAANGTRELDFVGDPRLAAVREKFYAVPLRELAPDCDAAAKRLSANLKKLADRIETASMPKNGP